MTQTLKEKISDIVFDDVCIEHTLKAMIITHKACARAHKALGFKKHVELNETMIERLETCLRQNKRIQKELNGC